MKLNNELYDHTSYVYTNVDLALNAMCLPLTSGTSVLTNVASVDPVWVHNTRDSAIIFKQPDTQA